MQLTSATKRWSGTKLIDLRLTPDQQCHGVFLHQTAGQDLAGSRDLLRPGFRARTRK